MNTSKIEVALNISYSFVWLIIDKVGHIICLKAQCLSGLPPTLVAAMMSVRSMEIFVIAQISEIIIKDPSALVCLQVALMDQPRRLDDLISLQLDF